MHGIRDGDTVIANETKASPTSQRHLVACKVGFDVLEMLPVLWISPRTGYHMEKPLLYHRPISNRAVDLAVSATRRRRRAYPRTARRFSSAPSWSGIKTSHSRCDGGEVAMLRRRRLLPSRYCALTKGYLNPCKGKVRVHRRIISEGMGLRSEGGADVLQGSTFGSYTTSANGFQ